MDEDSSHGSHVVTAEDGLTRQLNLSQAAFIIEGPAAERHNLAVLGSWDELIDNVGPRPGMFAGRPRYALVRSFVEGFGAAKDDDVLHGFEQWLSSQPQHRAIKNFAWPGLLLHEVFPERDRLSKPSWQ